METVNKRPGAATKKRSTADSLKQFVSTRRGAYTVAALAATLAGLVLLVFIDRYKDDVNAGLAPAPVLVADRLIPRGTSGAEVISNKLFKPAAVAEENIRPGAVTQASQITGTVAVREVLPGQQITVADFAASADPIRSRLTKKERAIQIPIDKIHGLLGTIRSGDRVDILAAFNATNATTGSGTPTLEPLVRDIRVMQNTGNGVILETTDQQGARLAFAADNAKLWFLLRPPVGASDSKPTSVSQDSLKQFELTVTSEETENGNAVTIEGKGTE
jgi:Flp pilus assembly protein CpaB